MLTKRLRKSDLVGRYGGEEFAIILPETEIETAKKLLDKVCHDFSQLKLQYNDVQFNCTLSAGLTHRVSTSNEDDLIRIADEALYEAKTSGKNKVCLKQ
jgi:diguanylate cyclase (GGDEF)-like protein